MNSNGLTWVGRMRCGAVVALLVGAAAFAGCSSSDSAKQGQGAGATDAATDAAAAASATVADTASETAAASGATAAASGATAVESGAPAAAGVADAAFPVYPGAKSQPIPAGMGQVDMCGHKQSITQYNVDADGKAVADWYKSHLPDAVMLDVAQNTDDAGSSSTAVDKNLSIEFMQPDGSGSVMVMQMDFANAGLHAAAKTIDLDKTSISFTHYDPPLGSDFARLMSQMQSGDASAKAAAKAKMATFCPDK